MEKKYEAPEATIIEFEKQDFLEISGGGKGYPIVKPWNPSSGTTSTDDPEKDRDWDW